MCWVCEQLDLHNGDIVEVREIENEIIKDRYPQVRVGTRGLVVPHDAYFNYVPDMKVGDPTHMTVLWEGNDPCNPLVLYQKYVSWAKVGRCSPQFQ